jgi:putative transposase
MARRPRLYVPDVSVHIIHRGINRMTIFEDTMDHLAFLQMIKTAMDEEDIKVHAFVLMKTHFHAIATPPRATALPHAMQVVGRRYTHHFNAKYDRLGTLWNERPVEKHLWDEKYWLTCLRYVELNPVRAGVVADPTDYEWSSYRVHAYGEPSDWLTPHPAYDQLGETPLERQVAYRALCQIPLTAEELTEIRLARENRLKRGQAATLPVAATLVA